jgi:hypothetical protein
MPYWRLQLQLQLQLRVLSPLMQGKGVEGKSKMEKKELKRNKALGVASAIY